MDEILINEPFKFFKSGLKFRFHSVHVQINIGVHGLNVHLVRITVHTFFFSVKTVTIFNNCTFKLHKQRLIVRRINFNFQSVHVTLNTIHRGYFNYTISSKVLSELRNISAVIIFQNKNGSSRVFIHVVLKVAHNFVKSVL